MNEPAIAIHFAGHGDHFQPGEWLTAQYQIEHLDSTRVSAIEISVLWHTEGKGDEDIGIHLFRRWQPTPDDQLVVTQPTSFSTQLPKSPLSYEGVIVKIRWCVRACAYLELGKQLLHERSFYLGHVKPPQAGVVHEPAQILLY